jgi:hypothetical protein
LRAGDSARGLALISGLRGAPGYESTCGVTLPSDPPDKDALIFALMARIEALVEQNAQLTARIAELEATLGLPPKTPDNSSTPPSKGQKPSGPSAAKAKANPHAGAHRPLHPNPTATRDVFAATCRGCGADVSAPRSASARVTTASRSRRAGRT